MSWESLIDSEDKEDKILRLARILYNEIMRDYTPGKDVIIKSDIISEFFKERGKYA